MIIENQETTDTVVPNDVKPPQLGLGTFTPYDSQAMSISFLLKQMLGNIEGIEIDFATAIFQGKEHAASHFGPLSLGPNTSFGSPGILLTSGDGAPARENTEMDFSFSNSDWLEAPYVDELDEGEAVDLEETITYSGDDQLTEIAQSAFEGAGVTYDAAVLEFSFKLTDPSIRSISLDLMFGSEEYPEFVDSPFVDIAAVIVNGTNYAYTDGEENKPLSIVGATTEDGRFVDNYPWQWNESGEMLPVDEAPLPIEYNGITPKLTISIPLVELTEGEDSYRVRIGIADTGDEVLDSGLFVSNFQALTSQYGGTLVNVEASDEGANLEAAAPYTATKFVGGKGNDTMNGSAAADVYDVQKGGANIIKGGLANLDNDTVVGFGADDTLAVDDADFTTDELTVTMGSAILDVDSDKNGTKDGTVKLEGDFRKGVFITTSDENGTQINYQALDTTPDSVQFVAADASEIQVEGKGLVKLLGDTAGKNVIVAEGNGDDGGVMNLAAGTDVILKGVSREDVQLLRDGTTLVVLDKDDGDTLVQFAASTDAGRVSTLTLEDGKFELNASIADTALSLGNYSFMGDGDRVMGSKWLPEFDDTVENVVLVGTQIEDLSAVI